LWAQEKWFQEDVMARSPQSLDDLKSSIEESMTEALQLRDDEPEPVEAVAPRETSIQPEGRGNADQLVETCNTTAAEIQATGDAVVQVAHSLAAETQALAEMLRKHGGAIAARIEEFNAMSKRVSEKLNSARADVLGATGAAPSIAPQLERDGSK
jgi:regulator of protease activity HflC (stomatin/prohibitin superfamily)